jgi:hypothetical protein
VTPRTIEEAMAAANGVKPDAVAVDPKTGQRMYPANGDPYENPTEPTLDELAERMYG